MKGSARTENYHIFRSRSVCPELDEGTTKDFELTFHKIYSVFGAMVSGGASEPLLEIPFSTFLCRSASFAEVITGTPAARPSQSMCSSATP